MSCLLHALPRHYSSPKPNGAFPVQIMHWTCTISCSWLYVEKDQFRQCWIISGSKSPKTFQSSCVKSASLTHLFHWMCRMAVKQSPQLESVDRKEREKKGGKLTIVQHKHWSMFRTSPRFETILECFASSSSYHGACSCTIFLQGAN